MRRRLDQLARRIDAKRIVLEVTVSGRFETGTPTAIAAASGRLLDENAKDVGEITVQHHHGRGLRAGGPTAA